MAEDPKSEQKALEESLDKEIRSIIEAEDRENRFNYAGLISSIFYLSVFIFIGLPIWYKTTTPERWALPDVSWLMVRSQTLTHYYKVSVVFLDPAELSPESPLNLDSRRLKDWLQNNHPRRQSFDGSLSFLNDWSVRNAFAKELNAYEAATKSLKEGKHPNLLGALDEKFAVDQVQALNSIVFYVLPRQIHTQSFINSGEYRALFIDLNHLPKADEDEGESVHSVMATEINRQVEKAQGIVEKFYSYQPGDNDQDIMLLLARNFDLIFDIIYEDEENIPGHAGHGKSYLEARKERHQSLLFNINELIDAFYTNRFNFSNYFKINFITQVLHYVLPSEFVASKLVKPTGNGTNPSDRLLPLSNVHSLLDHVESRRVEHDNEKSYHLILYVASSAKGALKFYDPASQEQSKLITTPFRGSVLILNEQSKADLFDGFRQLMRTFFRLNELPTSGKKGQFFTQIEIEAIVHALVQKHILKTLSSLESTEKLLKKVSNMVIEKKIAQRMQKSMDDSMQAAELLSDNGDIRTAYELSSNGYSLSEKAFFDPSLLSLLYFPDDQKYAIYLPLFLPICLPIIANMRVYHRFWKYLQGNSKVKRE